jgi:hypothetical protein
VLLSAADATLVPLTSIDGCVLACLIDQATGMVLASASGQSSPNLPTAAAAAADIGNVLAVLSSKLAAHEEPEDVIVTLSRHFHLIRIIRHDSGQRILLLAVFDRRRANLAMARHEIRAFCASLA